MHLSIIQRLFYCLPAAPPGHAAAPWSGDHHDTFSLAKKWNLLLKPAMLHSCTENTEQTLVRHFRYIICSKPSIQMVYSSIGEILNLNL